MGKKRFFWLHIKKCGGQSFRETFSPPYVQTDRSFDYKPFRALSKNQWNDALNNYRRNLGIYDFKRMQFAKKFLYSDDEFSNMFKFVIVRNPYDRLISCWKYLLQNYTGHPRNFICKPRHMLMKFSFHHFLKELPHLWENKYDRHIATHTAPIWSDITDVNGNLLVDYIIKLEQIDDGLKYLNKKLNLNVTEFAHKNKNRNAHAYRKFYDQKTRNLVEKLYKDDIQKLGYRF